MALLALDQSLTRTGYCFIPGDRFKPEECFVGSFASVDSGDFGDNLLNLLRQTYPHMIAFERPHDVIMMYGKKQLTGKGMMTPNANQMKLHRIVGVIEGIAASHAIPVLEVAPATWRSSTIGKKRWTTEEAKAAARVYCDRIGVKFKNHDQAEAVCLGVYSSTSTEYRYHLTRQD